MEINRLIKHYNSNYKTKVFMTKLVGAMAEAYIMYVYQYEKELENFSDTFLAYLPFYVRNKDYFATFDEESDLDSQLIERSKSIRKNSKLIPTRDMGKDGIYGELFLDFYLRIISAKKPILTYANKRSFASNRETTGIDNVVYYIDLENKINLCICEAKFVRSASNAKKDLLEDIQGTSLKQGHVTKEYLNDYFQFIVEKGIEIEQDDRSVFQPFLFELNAQLDLGNDFISIIISYDICVNFIFFAIFDSTKKEPDKLLRYYKEIYSQCEENVTKIGITNYKIEIVFIPTDNDTMVIKEAMEGSYE